MESVLLSYYLRHSTSCPYLSSHHLFPLTTIFITAQVRRTRSLCSYVPIFIAKAVNLS